MKNIISIFLASLLLSCSSPDNDLVTSIENELLLSNGKSINLAKVTDFKWERVCVINPYSMQEHQDRMLGFKTPLLATGNDGVSTLTFIKNNKVLSYINQPRNKGDFLNLLNSKPCYKYNEIINFK